MEVVSLLLQNFNTFLLTNFFLVFSTQPMNSRPPSSKESCNYCAINEENTYCLYGTELGDACGQEAKAGVEDFEKDLILEMHNDYRR